MAEADLEPGGFAGEQPKQPPSSGKVSSTSSGAATAEGYAPEPAGDAAPAPPGARRTRRTRAAISSTSVPAEIAKPSFTLTGSYQNRTTCAPGSTATPRKR
jgi:hypothetical protein